MTMPGTKAQTGGIHIELVTPNRAHIWSNWPVTSPRGGTSLDTKLLGEALEGGLDAKCDTRRESFFEADIGTAWFYFYIAHSLGRVYLIAAMVR